MSEYAGHNHIDISEQDHQGTLLEGFFPKELPDSDETTADEEAFVDEQLEIETDTAEKFSNDLKDCIETMQLAGCRPERVKAVVKRKFGARMLRLSRNEADVISIFTAGVSGIVSGSDETNGRTRETRDWAERAAGDDSWD